MAIKEMEGKGVVFENAPEEKSEDRKADEKSK